MCILAKPGNVHIRVIQNTRFDDVHISETMQMCISEFCKRLDLAMLILVKAAKPYFVDIRFIQNARFDDVHIRETMTCACPSYSKH